MILGLWISSLQASKMYNNIENINQWKKITLTQNTSFAQTFSIALCCKHCYLSQTFTTQMKANVIIYIRHVEPTPG